MGHWRVGVLGVLAGSGVGYGLASLMRQMPSPGATDPSQRLLVVQSVALYGLAAGLALATALGAAWIPSRRAAQTDPLDVIRGAT